MLQKWYGNHPTIFMLLFFDFLAKFKSFLILWYLCCAIYLLTGQPYHQLIYIKHHDLQHLPKNRDHRHDRGPHLLFLRPHQRSAKRMDLHLLTRYGLLDCRYIYIHSDALFMKESDFDYEPHYENWQRKQDMGAWSSIVNIQKDNHTSIHQRNTTA